MKGNRLLRFASLLLPILLASCTAWLPHARDGRQSASAGRGLAAITILQMNDIYELTPVSGGREGGLARVATIRKELLAENPNTLTVLAGDLFSPSALGTAKVGGERLADGRTYRVAINDFLISGKEQGLEFLSIRTPGLRATCRENRDIRFVFRDHLRKLYGGR